MIAELSMRGSQCSSSLCRVQQVMHDLARISHQLSAAAGEKAVSTALRSVTVLDVLSSTPARANHRAPCIRSLLPRLATTPGEKCGLREAPPAALACRELRRL